MTTKKADAEKAKTKKRATTQKPIIEVKENIPAMKKATLVKDKIDKNKVLDQLAKEQGVKPFDLDKATGKWPEGADFEKFKEAINSGRSYPREW